VGAFHGNVPQVTQNRYPGNNLINKISMATNKCNMYCCEQCFHLGPPEYERFLGNPQSLPREPPTIPSALWPRNWASSKNGHHESSLRGLLKRGQRVRLTISPPSVNWSFRKYGSHDVSQLYGFPWLLKAMEYHGFLKTQIHIFILITWSWALEEQPLKDSLTFYKSWRFVVVFTWTCHWTSSRARSFQFIHRIQFL
jgi:hypothetical protein